MTIVIKILSVFLLSDKMNKFIDFHKVMKARGAKYPFLILNMDRSDKERTRWWSILDIHPKKKFSSLNRLEWKD